MSKLKIGAFADDRPVAVTIRLPAAIYRDPTAYAELLKQEGGQAIDPNSLIAPMLARFMATDRAFRRSRRQSLHAKGG